MIETIFRTLLISATAALLVACGGGGDSGFGGTTTITTASTADKYVGTWVLCVATGGGSTSQTITFSKTGGAALAYTFAFRAHLSSDCSGTGALVAEGTGTVALTGTKGVGTETVDKWIVTENGLSEKLLAVIRNSRLFFSLDRTEPGFTEDAEGYPNTLDESSSLGKQ